MIAVRDPTRPRSAKAVGAVIQRDVEVNPNANQREIWLRDPDGYVVVLAGPSEYRPRP